jgi:MYXO-CTERM domain-containing protein
MLVDHLGDDLELQPASAVGHVPATLQIPDANQINVPERQCPDWNGNGVPDDKDGMWGWTGRSAGCAMGAGGAASAGAAWIVGAMALLILAGRARRRRG